MLDQYEEAQVYKANHICEHCQHLLVKCEASLASPEKVVLNMLIAASTFTFPNSLM
jgi:hypothetical protein